MRGLTGCLAILLVVSFGVTRIGWEHEGVINNWLQVPTSRIIPTTVSADVDTQYYKSQYADDVNNITDADLARLITAANEFVAEEMTESAVLLKNDNNALPLDSSERSVNLFGFTARQPLYTCASGGGKNDPLRQISFKQAFENAGFTINQTLYDIYEDAPLKSSYGGMIEDRQKDESDPSIFTSEVDASVQANGGPAIIFLSREGGEGNDIDTFVTESDGRVRTGLGLSNNEIALLEIVKEYKRTGAVSKIILIHNSSNPIELGSLSDYDVDAALHIGTIGLRGAEGLVRLLTGEANPSGHLVDTFATSALSAPAIENYGDYSFEGTDTEYMVTQEGIYTGYKYYETRYEDLILGRYGANSAEGIQASTAGWNYASEIVYPFGFGLSYTTFTQTLDDVNVGRDTVTLEVTVTNTGDVAGKSVVQVYGQSPYGEYERTNLIEKSAVQIIGFDKTQVLQPDQSETLEIVVDKYLLASYDHNNAEGYILSQGDYYFAIGDNAHDALNNILVAKGANGMYDELGLYVSGNEDKVEKWTLPVMDSQKYKYSAVTGTLVSNLFDDIDYNYWNPGSFEYLSRQDWAGTYPETLDNLTLTEGMSTVLEMPYTKAPDAKDADDIEIGVDANLDFIDMKDVDFDDPLWDVFVKQMTLDDLAICVDSRFATPAVESINKPATVDDDGPDGWNQKYLYGDQGYATAYIGQAIVACSFNSDLLARRGDFMAEDAFFCNTTEFYSPGGDLHRTPFSGRNFEYFSECGYMSYLCMIPEVTAMEARGISAGGKHFAGNDQEINRGNACIFYTEQAFRETSLKGFEGSFTIAKATKTMGGKHNIGLHNCSENKALLTDLLRGEWGFTGTFIADAGAGSALLSVAAGADQWCLSRTGKRGNPIKEQITEFNDGDMLEVLLEINHRYYYALSHSNRINGLTPGAEIETLTPWWQTTLITIDSVLGALTIGAAGWFVYLTYFKKGGK